MFKVIVFILLAFTGCTVAPVAPPPAPPPAPTPSPSPAPAPLTCPSGQWCYDDFVKTKVTQKMRDANPGIYCPKYKTVGPDVFWPAFEKAVARGESGWKLDMDYTEKFKDNSGKLQVSSGLFQISLDDKFRKGDCTDLSPENIHGNGKNIACAMTIQNALLGLKPTLQASLGMYWSTIRDNWNPTDKISLGLTIKKYAPGCF
jgi:hypothetical protein